MSMSARSPLAHPVALLALATLLLNDHVLKAVAPGPVTGKLSDLAGLVIAPLALAAVVGRLLRAAGRPVPATRLVIACALGIGVAFALVKATAGGALGWAWGLGTVQWLLGAAWLRGEAPMAVAVAADPTDLLALPTLVAAVAIAHRTTRAPRAADAPGRLAGPVLAIIAGIACLATSQAAPAALASASRQVGLDAANPAVAYRVTWSTDADSSGGQLIAAVPHGALTVSVVPDGDVRGSCVVMDGPASVQLSLGASCAPVGGGSATVLVQVANPDSHAGSAAGTLELSVVAYTPDLAAASAATMTLAIDPDPVFTGRPTEAGDTAVGTLSIGTGHPEASARLVLVVDGDALRDPLAWPLLGRIRASAALGPDGTNSNPGPITIAVGEEETWIEPARGAEVDWLALCRPAKPCRIPVIVTASWETNADPDPADAEATRDPEAGGGWATIAWSIDVRLQAFDGRELPVGAVRLEKP